MGLPRGEAGTAITEEETPRLLAGTSFVLEVAAELCAHTACACPLPTRTVKDLVRRRDLDSDVSVWAETLKHKREKQTEVGRKPGSHSNDWVKCRLWGHLQRPRPAGPRTTGVALGLYSVNGISPGLGSVGLSVCLFRSFPWSLAPAALACSTAVSTAWAPWAPAGSWRV